VRYEEVYHEALLNLISSKTKPISEENLAETFVLDIEARLSE
jgi:hypothetical protein